MGRSSSGITLRSQLLTVLLAVALLPVVVMGGMVAWDYQRETSRIVALAAEQEASAGRLSADVLAQSLGEALDGLDLIRGEAEGGHLTDKRLQALDHALIDITNLGVTDPTGRVVVASSPLLIGRTFAWLNLKQVRDFGGLYFSDIRQGFVTGGPVVAIALPYESNRGRFAGVVAAGLNLDALRAQLDLRRALTFSERLDLGDDKGHSFELVKPRRELAPHEPAQAYTTAIVGTPWHLTITRSLAHDLERPWQAAERGTALVALTLLVVGALGLIASRRLGGAFEDLASAVSHFSLTDSSSVPGLEPVGWTSKEYQDLRNTFRKLAFELVTKFEAAEDTRRSLEASVSALERLAALKRDFLANVSHELRTPLHHIVSYVSSLEDEIFGPMTAEQRSATGVVLKAADHLIDEIEQLLLVSQIEAGDFAVRLDEVGLGEFLEPLRARTLERCLAKGLVLSWEPSDLQVGLDTEKVRRVLSILLDNALKFTLKGGRVEVETRPDNGDLRLEVRDTGVGIAPEARKHVFESFYQADASSTRAFGGLGMGLHLAWRLVEAMGGRIVVEPREGGGTRATVWLPGAVLQAPRLD